MFATALAACSERESGPVVVSVIGTRAQLAEPLKGLPSPASKLILESTAQGLVAFDAAGDILPALAQRWIVEEDGRSYIFRLRRATWPNGARVTAKEVARMLEVRIESIRALDPDGPFDAVQEVVPMTGEVIEIRLSAARPMLLQLLAQPQLAILSRDGGTGPYRQERWARALMLTPVGDATDTGDDRIVPPADRRILRADRAALAVVRFRAEQVSLVLGGRFSDLPLVQAARIDSRAIRTDPVHGLLGLSFARTGPLVEDGAVRAAISMAIDRERLPALLGLGRWAVGDQFLPQQFDLPRPPTAPAWAGLSIEERRTQARAAIVRWRDGHGAPPPLRIALPSGPGSTLLFGLLATDLAQIGLTAQRVAPAENADLRLIDEVAPYDSAIWYLGRIGCMRRINCSPLAEEKMQEASLASTMADRLALLAEAEALMVAHNGYIALGAPVRWSLVSRRLAGFTPSPRARHPLNHLLRDPN
ncbi:ABC transporter substrate-binding protein [Sphingobium sp. AN641]|uniref:ABC transporter substrate-binding protein n=1 Tax=Sphingobium sp. AN641 TaxID=3133443 RepID=UPI0030C142F5